MTSQFCVMINFWQSVRSLLVSFLWVRSESPFSRVLLVSPRKLNIIIDLLGLVVRVKLA